MLRKYLDSLYQQKLVLELKLEIHETEYDKGKLRQVEQEIVEIEHMINSEDITFELKDTLKFLGIVQFCTETEEYNLRNGRWYKRKRTTN